MKKTVEYLTEIKDGRKWKPIVTDTSMGGGLMSLRSEREELPKYKFRLVRIVTYSKTIRKTITK